MTLERNRNNYNSGYKVSDPSLVEDGKLMSDVAGTVSKLTDCNERYIKPEV